MRYYQDPEHPLYDYHIQEQKILIKIRDLNKDLKELEVSQKAKLTDLKVGDRVRLDDKYDGFYIEEVRLDKYAESGITIAISTPNKDGSRRKNGRPSTYGAEPGRFKKIV